MLSDGALADIEAALGAVTSQSPLTGGDINRATRVQLADGRAAFVKTHPSPPPTICWARCGSRCGPRPTAPAR